jgi:ATP-dependent RNA helicase SUPV3L1/SUV3
MRSLQAMVRGSERADSESRLCALLGPTNTGKTHRAIERMLEFDTGVMGLPLRLLAREVYDRVSTRVGEQAVALVTGEEKRVPARPRYWICTTEAMPESRAGALNADFVAVDEIQLMGHPERGHVFTDRLLHTRGKAETWFMGSNTVESLLRTQLSGLHVTRLPRLSKLAHTGPSSLRTLPRRSAVVAFSMPEVYALADALRRRRGGAAVVLGALSPRVRNAQVALYQAGEVDFLVATDAIGMGLNLDIDHVALAGTYKFDGFETRPLESAELAQIAGRAGRYLRDGTFGTLSPEPELARAVVQQLEQHRFPLQSFAYYRNAELDFTSVAALLASLSRRPHGAHSDLLRSAPEGDDVQVLRCFARLPELSQQPPQGERLRALWDVCRVPNYEKRMPEHQAEQLLPLYRQLVQGGYVAPDFIEERVLRLARYEGDMHVLMDRLSAVRTWTYVTHQSGWLASPGELQARTRELEDKLSDALHERLLERFVEPSERRRKSAGSARPSGSAGYHPFASLAALALPSHEGGQAKTRVSWVERLIGAQFDELSLDRRGQLTFEGERVARLTRGQTLLRPGLRLLLPEWVEPGASSRIERRLIAHTRDLVTYLLAPLALTVSDSAPLRGLAYQLEQGLGCVQKHQARPQLEALSAEQRALIAEREVVVGRQTVYAAPLLAPQRLVAREALCKAWVGQDDPCASLSTEALYAKAPPRVDRELALALGFVVLATWVVRCDVLERLLALRPEQALEEAVRLLGAGEEEAKAVLKELPRARRRRRPGKRSDKA